MVTTNKRPAWPFLPLMRNAMPATGRSYLSGIVFDVDGTLCEPQNYMFQEMRDLLKITKSTDILEHLLSLPPAEKAEAFEEIKTIEREAMKKQTPQPGLVPLMNYLESRGIRKAICTRNFDEPIDHLLRTFLPTHQFKPIITRAFHPPKPAPDGILHIASNWQIPAEDRGKDLIMVGDSIDDMCAGSSAGATTVLLVNPANEHLKDLPQTHFCIQRLDELIDMLEKGAA